MSVSLVKAAPAPAPAPVAPVAPVESWTLWVCVDCYEFEAGCLEREPASDCVPLSLIPDGAILTNGLLDHDAECTEDDRESGGCYCASITFSWSACDGCGSTLGGAREALTLWED